MSLDQIKFEPYYSVGMGHNLLDSLYTPCLKNSVKYDRIAGFFSPKSLSAAAEGMASFINNGGKYKLIFSKYLFSKEDYEAIKDGYDKKFNEEFKASIDELRNALKDRPRKILGWMIANGHLEIKIAFKRPDDALLHSKWGNFEDTEGNRLHYNGSINETEHGWIRQLEHSDVFCSWNEGDKFRINQKFDLFETLWNNEAPNINVLGFTEVQRNEFTIDNDIESKEQFYEQCDMFDSEIQIERLEDINQSPEEEVLSPYEFQQEAIDAWEANNYKGIYALATGLGKTFTALFSLKKYAELNNNQYLCIIVCPSESLIYQWEGEIKKILKMNPIVLKDEKGWNKTLKEEIGNLNNGFEENKICLATYQVYYKENFISNIENCEIKKIIICDEVHNAGAQTWRKGLIESYDSRIALSATPERHFDEDGTSLIKEYFGGVVMDRDLEWGINNGFLSPYYYYADSIDLTEEELIEYRKITRKMMIFYDKTKSAQNDIRFLRQANLRAQIIKTAYNKINAFEELVRKLEFNLNGGFVFCGNKKFLERIQDILKKHEMRYRRFIAEEETGDRKEIIAKFKNKRLDAIAAIDCLDEGIDIPTAETAILLSSSSNSKQYIQRRGRVLRIPKENKDKVAKIYDFVCIPPIDDKSTFLMEQSIIAKQLKRLKEFSDISLNKDDNKKMIGKIANEWKIEV